MVKVHRVKSRVKAPRSVKRKEPVTPGSGDWQVELLNKYEENGVHCNTNIGEGSSHTVVIRNARKTDNGDGSYPTVAEYRAREEDHCSYNNICSHSKVSPEGSHGATVPLSMISPLEYNSTDIVHLVLQSNMANEERKKAIRDNIARMKRELQQKEEDEELQALLREEEELKAKLAGKPGPSGSQSKTGTLYDLNEFVQSNAKPTSNSDSKTSKVGNSNDGLTGPNPITDPVASLQNLTGIKFDMLGFLDGTGSKKSNENKNVATFVEDERAGMSKGKKCKRSKHQEEESETEQDSDSSSSSEDEDEVKRKNPRKGKFRSGRHDKPSDTKLVSNEWYAHTALDKTLGGEREFNYLSFNLLVTGELEIISSKQISKKEIYSQLELLKQLAYKHEVMNLGEILSQYASFVSKVEKGKFRWGSKRDLSTFEQQLMYAISMDRSCIDGSGATKVQRIKNVKDDKKKYCLDYNKGVCRLQAPHKGFLNGTTVIKHHLCKKCLIEEGVERAHPSKDCIRK